MSFSGLNSSSDLRICTASKRSGGKLLLLAAAAAADDNTGVASLEAVKGGVGGVTTIVGVKTLAVVFMMGMNGLASSCD